jgi:ubiquinone/menaquinone biosynthesis C-methylase UbiE
MSSLELMIDLHIDGDRQGPGSTAETLRALHLIDTASAENLKVADIGCGTGAQTIALAQNIHGHITAVDLYPQFLAKLDGKVKELGLGDKISSLQATMEKLPFEPNTFDIIWSEGAIYNMGFEAGIKSWGNFLKPGGYLAVSEITWLTKERPTELDTFWTEAYPEIDMASGKIRTLEENGYLPVGYFLISEESWLKNYYMPLRARFAAFSERHPNSEAAIEMVAVHNVEIKWYQQYKDYYSYGFYVAKKL